MARYWAALTHALDERSESVHLPAQSGVDRVWVKQIHHVENAVRAHPSQEFSCGGGCIDEDGTIGLGGARTNPRGYRRHRHS